MKTMKEINSMCKRIKKLQHMVDELNCEIDALKNEVREFAKNSDENEINVGDYIVKLSVFKSNRFDTNVFKADHSRLFKKYNKTYESVRLNIK